MNSAYSFPMSTIFRSGAGNSLRRQAPAAAGAQSGNFLPLHGEYSVSDEAAEMAYTAALADAVAWLGNRYLLARPVKRLAHPERCDTRARDKRPAKNAAHLRM
jgi:hypothetical protein